MRYRFQSWILAAGLACSPSMAQEQAGRSMIVFDASGSMWGQIDGEAKISIARETFSTLFDSLRDNLEVGLVAYGHRRKGDCSDIETLVPTGSLRQNRQALLTAVSGLNPKGKTPLTEAVRRAAEALRYTEDKATVVLVTDGLETCDADPCALANELERSGIDFTAHVVGFGLSRDEGRQVACLAENTGGTYFPADNSDDLASALQQTVALQDESIEKARPERVAITSNLSLIEGGPPLDTTAPYRLKWSLEGPLDATGAGPVVPAPAGREGGLYHELVAGKYRYSVSYAFDGYAEKIIETGGEEEQSELIPINGARIEAFADLSAGGQDQRAIETVRWQITDVNTQQKLTGNGAAVDFYVPPGSYSLSVVPPRGKFDELAPIEFEAKAGDVIPASLLLPHGKVSLTPVERDGSVNREIRYLLRTLNPDGTVGDVHRFIASAEPIYAMPGTYRLFVELFDGTKRKLERDIEVPFADVMELEVQLP
ncbi:MAG: VWA domain-containing protein [Pseudomonadota bacterium]